MNTDHLNLPIFLQKILEKLRLYPTTLLFVIYISFMVTVLFVMSLFHNGGF